MAKSFRSRRTRLEGLPARGPDALIVKRDAASDALNAYYDTYGDPDEDEQERLEDAANAASGAGPLWRTVRNVRR
jgi:hypothetical protein